MIKPASDIISHTIPADGLTYLVARERTGTERIVFVRFKREYGIILITSHPHDGMTRCKCITNNKLHQRWYRHVVSTTRQAAILANRFLADLEKEEVE